MARILLLGGIPESLVKFRRELIEEMVLYKHQVVACAPNASKEIKETLSKMGVVYHNIGIDRTGLNPISDFKNFIKLTRLIKKVAPDVFLGYTIKPVVFGSLAAQLVGVRKIFSMIEGVGYAFSGIGFKRQLVSFIAQQLYKFALKYNTNIFFLNKDDLTLFVEKGLIKNRNKSILINGIGINLEKFTLEPYPDCPTFLLIARLVFDKGIQEFIEASKIIKKRYPFVCIKLVGFLDANPSSVTESELQSWVKAGIIDYLGYQRDVRKVISESSVYVLPSYREGLPVTIMESMAMGRPIITTDAPGCRETVRQGENGFLVPTKNVDALADAMQHFINKPDDIKRMGLKSREIAVEKFDVHKINAHILKTMGLH